MPRTAAALIQADPDGLHPTARAAVELLASGKARNAAQVGEQLGITRQSVGECLAKPNAAAAIVAARLRQQDKASGSVAAIQRLARQAQTLSERALAAISGNDPVLALGCWDKILQIRRQEQEHLDRLGIDPDEHNPLRGHMSYLTALRIGARLTHRCGYDKAKQLIEQRKRHAALHGDK